MNIYFNRNVAASIRQEIAKWKHFHTFEWNGTYSDQVLSHADVLLIDIADTTDRTVLRELGLLSEHRVLLIICSKYDVPRSYTEINMDPQIASIVLMLDYKDANDIKSHILTAINLHHVALQSK